jgi:Amt family ammonium transporter
MEAGHTTWVLVSAALVMFMTPGLAFFYGGMVRSKNVLAMLMQNFIALGVVSTLWGLFTFSLAFGPDLGGLIGDLSFSGMRGVFEAKALPGYVGDLALSIPAPAFFAYQMMFAVITPALISGALADRIKFSAYVAFITLWSVFCYAPVAHWVFSPNGWLFKRGALDFAGGTVVHINAGIAALVAALVIGRRKNWPREAMPPHNLPLTLLGTGILWFGWIGFNAGSALAAGALAAQALINTHMAAALGMIGWVVGEKLRRGHATTLGAASGAVAGLVAITPCAGYVTGGSAMIVGLAAGIVCFYAVDLKFRFGFDDALDVVGVHLVGGILGSLLVGIFASKAINSAGADGLLNGGGLKLLGEQALAVVVVIGFTGALSFVLVKVLDKVMGLRVDEEAEYTGLDRTQHAEAAYAMADFGGMARPEGSHAPSRPPAQSQTSRAPV